MNKTPLPPDFEKHLAESSDAELVTMLNHQDDYLPEAVAALKKEIERRHPKTSGQANTTPPAFGTEPSPEAEPAETPEDEKNLSDPALTLGVVATFRNVVDAGLFKARLEAAGIEADIPEEYAPHLFWNIIPNPLESVTVRVAAKDIEAAKALLADYTDTVFTAVPPGLDEAPESPPVPQPPIGEIDPANHKICVSCRVPMPADAALCPKCGWTQPDKG